MPVPVPTVNFHLWAPCDMGCRFCFAPFHDVRAALPKGHLPQADAVAVVGALAAAGFERVNFVGGEPLLCPWLPALLAAARRGGAATSVVTNGGRLTAAWLRAHGPLLDGVGLSVDSASEATHRALGRARRGRPLPRAAYVDAARAVRARGLRLKVNTVVTALNAGEDLTGLLAELRPDRWKVFQVLPVAGQNDGAADLLVSRAAFDAFVERHAGVAALGVDLVPEPNDLMRGSYAMVDPAGRFFDNAAGGHRYSRPVLEAGVAAALAEVAVDAGRFDARGGRYALAPAARAA